MKTDHLLIRQFVRHHPKIALSMIDELEVTEIVLLIEDLPLDQSIELLSQLPFYRSGKVIEGLTRETATKMIDHLPLSIAESTLRTCDSGIRSQILQGMDPEKANHFNLLLTFNRDQIGAFLDPFVFTLFSDVSIEQALNLVSKSKTTVAPQVFVMDESRRLVGFVALHELLSAHPNKTIQSILRPVPISLLADMNVRDVLETWDHSFADLPVTKINGAFMGTVSRAALSQAQSNRSTTHSNSVVKAGNALGDLYLIGLSSLLGSADLNKKS